jgi:UbiD family decarboxylase
MGYTDLRDWLAMLDAEGELKRIKAEVDWNLELGSITAMARQKGLSGLLFENIKDYQTTGGRRLFTGSLVNHRQVAMMFGVPKDTQQNQLVNIFRQRFKNQIKPVTVKKGRVKENIVKGKNIDILDFPVPLWNKYDGGRYIGTLAGVVTRDPDNGVQNVGIYRSMVVDKNTLATNMNFLTHGGQHFSKFVGAGEHMPCAVVIGFDPTLAFAGCAPVPRDVCEYDVMGSIRQKPVELIKCETSDLEVPAAAELVIEGTIDPDPATYAMEGPFGEYTGYYAWRGTKKPVMKIKCITHRDDPILVGTLASALPGQPGEGACMMSIVWAGMVWEVIERSGIPGLLEVRFLPPSCETTVVLKIHKTYRGQGKHIAMALVGSSLPFQSCKNIIVVDDDIDIFSSESLQWAIDYRVNPAEHKLIILPEMPSIPSDPSVRMEKRDPASTGGVSVTRMIIDATKNWSYGRKAEWDNDFYPPVNKLSEEQKALVLKRWKKYGLET